MQLYAERQLQLQAMPAYGLHGRVGIRTADDGWTGGLDWLQRGNFLEFSFRGPLGAGGIQVSGDADQLRVKTSRGEEFVTREPELDFTDEFGWTLPVRSMRYWILGVPDPDRGVRDLDVDAAGLLRGLGQAGWVVEITDYMSVKAEAGSLLLPRRMQLTNANLRIKLAVHSWDLTHTNGDP